MFSDGKFDLRVNRSKPRKDIFELCGELQGATIYSALRKHFEFSDDINEDIENENLPCPIQRANLMWNKNGGKAQLYSVDSEGFNVAPKIIDKILRKELFIIKEPPQNSPNSPNTIYNN